MLAKSVLLTSAVQFSTTATMLARSIIFAHMLSPEDYGLAMTFGVVILFCEHISNFGHDSFILRSKNGDDKNFQSTMHASILIRGIFISLLLIVLAPRIPIILGLQKLEFNFIWLALIPFINGFINLDYQRLNRQFNYSVSAKLSIFSDVTSILLALSLAFMLESYWAYLISMTTRHIVFVFLSHLLARRKYRVSIDKTHFQELFRFGWPILLISCLRYLCIEADKIIVVRYLGLAEFTSYILSMLVIRQTSSLSVLAYTKIFIRRISEQVGRQEQLHAYKTNAEILIFLTSPVLFALTTFGESLIAIAFGKQYQAIPFLVPMICGLIAMRLPSYWLNHIVIASDDTGKMLKCTIISLLGFFLAIYAAANGMGSLIIVASFIVGEVIYTFSLTWMLKSDRRELPGLTARIMVFNLLNILLATLVYWQTYELLTHEKFIVTSLSVITMLCGFLATSDVIRRQVMLIANELRIVKL